MNKPLLAIAMLAMATYGQAQVQVGRTFTVDLQEGLNDRGTDTLYTFGVDQAAAAGQIAGYVTPGGGMLFGPSEFPTEQFAQEFELIDGPANIDGIVFLFASRVYGSNDPASHVKARLYAMDATGGQTSQGPAQRPGTVLAEVQLPVEETTDMGFSGVSFAPIWVSSSFAAGFSLNGLNSADSLNLAATTTGFVELSDRSWLTLGGVWATVLLATTDPNTPGSGSDIDYFVGAVLTPSAVSVGEQAWMNGMQMDLLGATRTAMRSSYVMPCARAPICACSSWMPRAAPWWMSPWAAATGSTSTS